MKLSDGAHIHILGIAGHAMRGVALAARELGYTVTGTDETAYAPGSDWLDEAGITWWREASPDHLQDVDLLVLGGGVAADHAELIAAQQKNIRIQSYPELVSELISTDNRIVVTGTHGKTTTTSLIAWLLESAGKNPDFLIGIQPKNFDTSVHLHHGEVAVLEGDEYRSSRLDTSSKFNHYAPKTAIITSIEMDHPDLFADLAAVRERFEGLVANLPADGYLVYHDDDIVRDVASKSSVKTESYGGDNSDWRATDVTYDEQGIGFTLNHRDEAIGEFRVGLYGEHNVLNATAGLAICLAQDVSIQQLQEGAASFLGASRRFERVSDQDSKVTVIDDYAHHPTEVAATIAAAKLHFSGRVIAVFQPHTYSRTQSLLKEYQACFAQADAAYIVDIEGARETGTEITVTSADVAVADNVTHMTSRQELLDTLKANVKPGDVLLCMSVNGYDNFAAEINTLINS